VIFTLVPFYASQPATAADAGERDPAPAHARGRLKIFGQAADMFQ